MLSAIETGTLVPAAPAAVFDLWLDPVKIGLLTGGPAHIDASVGGHYSLFGGSVVGQYVFFERPRVVAQTWRTDDFGPHMDDSRLELVFARTAAGTMVRITHVHIPPHLKEQFLYGWDQFILPKLREHFRTPEA